MRQIGVVLLWTVACAAPLTAQKARPAHWPDYLSDFSPPQGRDWSQYRVRDLDGMPQALVPAGEFMMGAVPGDSQAYANEAARKAAVPHAYWVDLHTVTNAQFGRFLAATGYRLTGHWSQRWAEWSEQTKPEFPAVYVSWFDATAYARWAGASLPAEAQWERAARGGKDGRVYPWGNQADQSMANGNWNGERALDEGVPALAPRYVEAVASRPANGYGLYDMCGNVWQWCLDQFTGLVDQQPGGHNEPVRAYVVRGGSWYSTARGLRTSCRYGLDPRARTSQQGFRCVQQGAVDNSEGTSGHESAGSSDEP